MLKDAVHLPWVPQHLKVLLSCIRCSLGVTEGLGSPSSLYGYDWDALLQVARSHGVFPSLGCLIDKQLSGEIPDEAREALRGDLERLARRRRLFAQEFRSIVGILSGYGLPSVSLGETSVVDHRVATVKQPEFLEIFIPRDRVFDLKAPMRALGYRPRYPVSPAQRSAFLMFQAEYRFTHEVTRCQVSFRWDIIPAGLARPLGFGEAWERGELVANGKTSHRALSAEDRLLALCARAASQGWARLDTIAEVATLLQGTGSLDWNGIIERSRAGGYDRMVTIGVRLAGDILGKEPCAARLPLATHCPEHLIDRVRRSLMRGVTEPPGRRQSLAIEMAAISHLRGRIRYGVRRLVTPTEADWRAVTLPLSLTRAYYLLRPLRLLANRTLNWFQPRLLAPMVPSVPVVVDRMLDLASVSASDVVYDLGCGDGRLLIQTAKRHGARGVGVDIDPECVAEATANARREGVDGLITFQTGDALAVDLSEASVVFLFLSRESNLRLRPRLLRQLRAGSRIVSHHWDMGEWKPLKTSTLQDGEDLTPVYLWRVQASAPPATESDRNVLSNYASRGQGRR
jgi:SAM-dependent methyltransferase